MNNKTRIVITVAIIIISLIWGFVFYWKYYLFPSKYDFQRNGEKYMEIINLMNQDEYGDIVSMGSDIKFLKLKNSGPDYYKEKIIHPQKYINIVEKVSKIWNTHFTRCWEDFIKINKWWTLNRYFELTYVYSKKWFKEMPKLMREIIDEHMIIHHNAEWYDYSADYYCKVQ